MSGPRDWLKTWLGLAVALLAWCALTLLLWNGSLAETERASWQAWLLTRAWWLLLWSAAGLCGLAWWLRRWHRHHLRQAYLLAEQAQALASQGGPQRLPLQGNAPTQALAQSVNALADQRDALRADMSEQVAQASQAVATERQRLASLVAELPQAVVVCNGDGLILLYNRHAVALLQEPETHSAGGLGTALLGLGRSIYGLLEPQHMAHALSHIALRQARGETAGMAQLAVIGPGGKTLHIQVAALPVTAEQDPGSQGFVLMLHDVSAERLQAQVQTRQLFELALAAQQAWAQAATGGGDAPGQAALDRLVHRLGRGLQASWPLQDMLAEDAMHLVQQRLRTQHELVLDLAVEEAGLWLRADSFALTLAFEYLVLRLRTDLGAQGLRLRIERHADDVHLDVVWRAQALSTETIMSWHIDPLQPEQRGSELTLRDVLERHSAELGFERDRLSNEVYLRWVLPLIPLRSTPACVASPDLSQADAARPEFYDFDLFQRSSQVQAWEDRTLRSLTYTVFDTETTGLQPSQGDAIIQMGAVRCVNNKLLRSEHFDQLVDPQRTIPAQTIDIHGITPEMVRGQPVISQVLPAFHRFVQDSVLVAHNAAFDMKFLQLQSRGTGLQFDQPVLDTLLLSAMVHPNQDSHRLDAIAERFGITVLGRHTALGDALVTAEVWLRLIPLLEAMGVHTLGQARELARQSYYARLRY
jgi:DNA polymerase-3 subunit epsilon